jgi:hypothetical protein
LQRGAAAESERDALRAELAQLASNYATAAAVHIVDQRELAAANAEVERLRAVHTADVGQLCSALATANAPLERLRKLALDPERLRLDKRIPLEVKQELASIVEDIAAQPATAPVPRLGEPRMRAPLILPDDEEPTRPETDSAAEAERQAFLAELDDIIPSAVTRTKAEQAVLDAMARIREEALRRLRKDNGGSVADAIDAELARRGLK